MSEVAWTRCFQHGSTTCNIDLTQYYTNGSASGGWRDSIVKRIEEGLVRLETGLKSGGFKKGDYSIYSGTSGLALLYLRLSETLYANNPTKRRHALDRALELITQPLNKLNGRKLTFLCGDGGVLALGAVLYTLCDNSAVARHCTQGLQTLSELALTDHLMSQELMYGCAGYLFALLFTKKYLPDSIDTKLICRVAAHIVSMGKEEAKCCSGATLLYTWHEKHYLGAAHGLAGILYTLLQSSFVSPQELSSTIAPSVNYLLSQRYPSNNLRSSLSSQLDQLVQWCHGSPGFVPLLTEINEQMAGGIYLQEAIKCATPIWQRGLLRKSHGLCHGTLGNAYAFLDMYQHTDDPTWLSKAVHFTEWSMSPRDVAKNYDKEMKLFDGLAGVIYFYCDMLEPKSAAFPGFQVPK